MIVTIVLIVVSPTGPFAWIAIVSNIVVGVVLGIVLQPAPVPKNNSTHAEFAVGSLVSTARSVASSGVALRELVATSDQTKVIAGLPLIEAEFSRTLSHLLNSIAEWDKIEPGVTDRVAAELKKRADLAKQFGIEDLDA